MERPRNPNSEPRLIPLLLGEQDAAHLLDESPETRRVRRYEDKRRAQRGEPIHGPAWIQDGKRIKYRLVDIEKYVTEGLKSIAEEAR